MQVTQFSAEIRGFCLSRGSVVGRRRGSVVSRGFCLSRGSVVGRRSGSAVRLFSPP